MDLSGKLTLDQPLETRGGATFKMETGTVLELAGPVTSYGTDQPGDRQAGHDPRVVMIVAAG